MESEPDWDLHAVVRGFAAISKPTSTAFSNNNNNNSTSSISTAEYVVSSKQAWEDKGRVVCSTNLAVAEDLHELYAPYLFSPDQTGSGQAQPTVSSYLAGLDATKHHPTLTLQQHKGRQLLGTISASTLSSRTTTSAASASLHKPKRRKNQLKKVCHVPAESLSSDIWSWRKYGQKPIKGSPYPRGYYKCSSSKACLARKQVERNRSDPNMFIVTYTAEHNHPAPTHKNSLAGTTRHPNHLSSPTSAAHDELNLPTCKPSSSSSMATMSPVGSLDDGVLQQSIETESKAIDSKGDIRTTNLVEDVLGFFDMDVNDGFFDGLDDIVGTPPDCCLPDQILPSFPV